MLRAAVRPSSAFLRLRSRWASPLATEAKGKAEAPPVEEQAGKAGAAGGAEGAADADNGGSAPGFAFLLFIGALGGYFWRSSKGSSARRDLIREVKESMVVAPGEVEELREDNNIPPSLFREVAATCVATFPDGIVSRLTFDEVASSVALPKLQQQLEHMHYMERMFISLNADPAGHIPLDEALLAWLLMVGGDADERLTVVYDLYAEHGGLSETALFRMLECFLKTCQIPARFHPYLVSQWPHNTYERMSGERLVEQCKKSEVGKSIDWSKPLQPDDFLDIMTSRPICVWGECFSRERKKRAQEKKKKEEEEGEAAKK